jgi:hypothetical protein
MAEFECQAPIIPQLNLKNISSKSCQMLESESLSCNDLNAPHRSTQEYNLKVTRIRVLSLADHD